MAFSVINLFKRFLVLIPLFLLFFLVISEVNFNFEKSSYLSFNLIHILIFYWILKNPNLMGYGFIFLAGMINDVIMGLPIGISSFTYLILSATAAYVRYLTVEPNILYDWIIFIPSIAITNSIYFFTLNIFFNYDLNHIDLALNTAATIVIYPVIGLIFNFFIKIVKN